MNDTLEANGRLGRKFFAEQDRRRGGPAPELCAPDYTAVLGGNPPIDRDGHEGFAQGFYAAFEGMNHEIEDVIASDAAVVVRFRLHGKHTGAFFGIPATGKTVDVAANVILHVRDGKVSRVLGIFDEAGLLRQLGVLPG